MKSFLLATALTTAATFASAAPEKFTVDASHAQIVFSYNHVGYSTNWGMFSGFEGEIMFDQDNPANSSVSVSMPVRSMLTGWEARFQHFMSGDFFGASEADLITFTSTGIEVTGDNTALITGDLSMNGNTAVVVLDAVLNQVQPYTFGANQGKPAAGFSATTTVKRSDFGVGAFAPAVSDELKVELSLEAVKLD